MLCRRGNEYLPGLSTAGQRGTTQYACCIGAPTAKAGDTCSTGFVNPQPTCGAMTSMPYNLPPYGGAGNPVGPCLDQFGFATCRTANVGDPACKSYFPPVNGSTVCH